MTTKYKNALTAVREATAKFHAVRDDYRAMKIGDSEFLAAKAEYAKVEAIFDKAYGEEATLAENNQAVANPLPRHCNIPTCDICGEL